MFGLPNSPSRCPIRNATAAFSPAMPISCVFRCVLMAMRTMGFGFEHLGVVVGMTCNVLAARHRHNVSRVTAATRLANMMQVQVGRAEERFPDKSMNVRWPRGATNDSVAICPPITFPNPAACIGFDVDLFQNSLWQHKGIIS